MTHIIDQFDAIICAHENSPALQTDRIYTYGELQDQARRFATYLSEKNCTEQEPRVVLNLSKSADYIIAVLGCFYAGWAFTPVDPSMPKERQDFILQDIDPHLVVTAHDMIEALSCAPLLEPFSYPLDHLAYIIYTSGSTGQPKGVMVEHKGLPNVINQQIKQFDIGVGDHSFLLLSISFDASLSDIFCALLSGACLHIAEGDRQHVASELKDILHERDITHIDIPPSMLRILDPDDVPKSLRSIIIGGEVCPYDTVKKWADHVLLNNVYGPTEASICTSMITCQADEWERPLIGRSMDHVEYVIDNGELLIGGVQLARGYWRRDDLTESKFITQNGKRFYRTGDHVEQHEDGHISFLGRLDRQVKIRGQLVELEEVEQQLLKHNDILRVSVIAQADKKGTKQLIAYYQSDFAIDRGALAAQMSNRLPEWMVPARFIQIDEFPLTPSGKIDAQKLITLEIKSDASTNIVPPQTPRQKTLWRIWRDILKHDQFGITDSFFDLGGDSVDAIDFTLRAVKENLSISPSMLSKNFTIQYLDKMLTALTSKDQSMHVNELRQLIVIPSVVISAKNAGQSVFMTGATGFLGKRLLNDLLARTDDHYTCLVRASSREEGQKRLNIADQYRNRVDVICGDFTKPRFGLIDEDWQKLVQETRSIIHCGAVVNMVTSFEELRAANFDACLEVMRLALEGGVKHIDYISTLSVFVSTDQNTGTVFEHDMLETIGHVYGGYAQSKVAAELAFHNPDFTEYCSVTSYRLGLITGDTNNGMAAAHDFLSTFVRGISQLGCVPECDASRFTVDVTPVDYASDCLAKLITLDNKQDCYHIANSKGFSLAQMIAALKRKGIDLSVIPAKEWAFISQDRKLSSQEQATWLGLCRALPDDEYQRYRSMDLFQGTDIIFDQTRLRTSLPDVSCPPASDDLLDLYIDNMI